jgi:putative glutamine amidotransferase
MGSGVRSGEDRGRAPLVGLTTSEVRTVRTLRPIRHGDPTPHEFALAISYVRAIEQAGGVPLIVPPMAEARLEPILDSIDGLCLPGGPDLDPSTYREPEHAQLGPFDPEVDRFELQMIDCADQRELPILAICRGAQALNVARGGTLIQHLPDLETGLLHRQTTPGTETSHPVTVAGDSLLREIVGADTIDVNSFHHQGIKRLGRDLRAVAFAPDDTVEALEAEDRRFCLGVQWHAETLVHREEHAALFHSFVETCAGSRAGQSGATFPLSQLAAGQR